MSASLARFLKDFSAPAAPPPVIEEPAFDAGGFDMDDFMAEPPPPPVDVEAERAEAFAEGRAAAIEELQAAHAAEIEALKEAHGKELETIRADNQAAIAALNGRIGVAKREIAEEVSAATFNALIPLIDEMLATKATDKLASEIRRMFEGEDAVEVTVHGPQDMTGALVKALEKDNFKVRHIDAPGPDLTVERGEMVFATRLAAWIDGVRELIK